MKNSGAKRVSMRTCIGCRGTAPRDRLVRTVLQDGQLVVDSRRRFPGRGASVHPGESCLRTALVRRAFARAFRAPVQVGDAEGFIAQVLSLGAGDGQGDDSGPAPSVAGDPDFNHAVQKRRGKETK